MSGKPNPDAFAGLVRTTGQTVERAKHADTLARVADDTYRDVVRQLEEARQEVARLRRVNHQTAQRAFFLQPGLRVQVGGHPGVTQESPVMVPVLLDGMHQAGRFPAEFVHLDTSMDVRGRSMWSATVDGEEQHGTAQGLRLTPLDADVEVAWPFQHQPGSVSDYLEALAEEVCHGKRTVESLETMAHGNTLKIHIRFDVPSKRAQLTDLLYVNEP